MKFVIDTNSLSQIFKSFYFETFPSFWEKFNYLAEEGVIVSTREVMNELLKYNKIQEIVNSWMSGLQISKQDFFTIPTVEELHFVREILEVPQFIHSISKQSFLQGKPCADPFVIAKAQCINGAVITEESYKPNSARIPNICKFFDVPNMNLREMLLQLEWRF